MISIMTLTSKLSKYSQTLNMSLKTEFKRIKIPYKSCKLKNTALLKIWERLKVKQDTLKNQSKIILSRPELSVKRV